MEEKEHLPIYQNKKPTVDLNINTDASSTSRKDKLVSYDQGEGIETTKVSLGYTGEKAKASNISYKIIGYAIPIFLAIVAFIFYLASLGINVNYIKDELKTVKNKILALSESSISQEVKITNIDNNLNEIHSDIRELYNIQYNNLKK